MAPSKLAEIERLGNHPVLDFINTVHNRHAALPGEYLATFEDLVEWHELAGLITKASSRALHEEARQHPRKAAAAHRAAIELRELLHDIFLALVQGRQPSAGELCDLNAALNRLRPCCLLAAGEEACQRKERVENEAYGQGEWAQGDDRSERRCGDYTPPPYAAAKVLYMPWACC